MKNEHLIGKSKIEYKWVNFLQSLRIDRPECRILLMKKWVDLKPHIRYEGSSLPDCPYAIVAGMKLKHYKTK